MEESVIFGRRPVEELLKNKIGRIKQIYTREGVTWLSSEELERYSNLVIVEERDKFQAREKENRISNSQGVIAYISPSTSLSFSQLLERSDKSSFKVLIALDQVQDPHNLGAIFRVCDAVGVAGLFYPEDRNASVNSTVRKVSAGASEFLPYSEVKNLARSLELAKKAGYLVYGTTLGEGSKSLYEAVYSEPMVVVFGSEGDGLRRQTKDLCDEFINIPMQGSVQSLNVSTSASAVLFEIRRRLGGIS